MQTRKYTDNEDIERYATDIIEEKMQMLGAGNAQGEEFSCFNVQYLA
jgi:single-stranded DNA-binding protein